MRHGFHRSAPAISLILLLAVPAGVAAEDTPDLSKLTLERIFEEEEFEVETFSGRIKNAFGPEAERTSEYAPGQELRFTTGGGDASVEVESFSGTVEIAID